MRAREPDRAGYVERDGVRIYYECFGDGEQTIVFPPSDSFVTGRMWKAQVPFLARRYRVVVIDPRGNGRSDRPTEPAAYADEEYVADLVAVMDEVGVERALLVGLCMSGWYALLAAARHPDRVDGVVAIGPWADEGTPRRDRGGSYLEAVEQWDAPYAGGDDWWQYNRELWLADWPRWPRFWFDQIVTDPHSTKVKEDLVGWSCQSTGAVQVAAHLSPASMATPEATRAMLRAVACPVLVVQGTRDTCQRLPRGACVARLTGGELLALGGAGHVPPGRDPVAVNHAIDDFARRVAAGSLSSPGQSPVVRAHLTTRSDAATGSEDRPPEPPQVVVVPAHEGHAAAWKRQLPALGHHAGYVVADDPAAALAGFDDPALVVLPPDRADLVSRLPGARVAAVLLVEAPAALAEQAGLLEFFVDRLPGDHAATVVRALVEERPGRAPVVAVVDDRQQSLPIDVDVDVVVTVEGGAPPPVERTRGRGDRRVLFLSSPIGLGHVRRDLAIADALRRQHPDVEVDWLSQSPVTEFLERRGERVHPASAYLAAESAHIEAEAGEHDLHAFQAIRRMDEILVNNFHVFDDLVAEREYDAWVADEAWDVDHFLHENPRLKRAPFVWLTDFVGWLPMPDGGESEAALAADYNAEMVEHVARHPSLRDRSVFVGDPEDVVPASLGPDLPGIREWTEQHFAFSGYVMGERPSPAARERLRADLGHQPDETVCVVSVGGSGVGGALLERVVAAYDASRAEVPSLRMLVVTGPRIDPSSVPERDGVAVRGFVPDLDLHHAACDVAIVQGGLSTTMELTAAGRPFLYVPLRHHFEQQFHVRHRLERHRAGRALDYDDADPDTIAAALVEQLGSEPSYVDVPSDGAERAAVLVAEVI